jgi:hypothetical protein
MKGSFILIPIMGLLLGLTALAQESPDSTGNGGTQTSATIANAADGPYTDLPRYEIGGGFTTLVIANDTRAGFGFRGVRNFSRALSLEGEFNWSLGNTLFRVEGGHMLEGLFGVKAGHRGKRAGIFAKARPGFITFTDIGTTFGALDLGGVVEFYPATQWLIRGDVGDTMVLATRAATQVHNAQFGISVHYRF